MTQRGWTGSGLFGILMLALAGCGGDAAADGECAAILQFDGRTYIGSGVQVAPREGSPIGSGVMPGCDDGGGASPDEAIELAQIEGVSPQVALAWRGMNDTVWLAEGVDELPPEVRQLLRAPTCDASDAPIELLGPWRGISAGAQTELDLVPPYDVDLFVAETSSPRYERAFLTVRVPEELGRPLTRDDIRASLWEGGTVELSVRCEGGRYVAESVTAHAPD